MNLDWTEIILGLFTLIGIIYSAYYRYRSSQLEEVNKEIARKEKEAKKELDNLKEKTRIDVALSFPDWTKLYNILKRLKDKTGMDRFLVLLAENGSEAPLRITSVKWEWHVENIYKPLSMGAVDRYTNVVIEPQYLNMIKTSEATREIIYYDVNNTMEDGQLREYYKTERVCHSAVVFGKREILRYDKHALLYFSLATHREFQYSEDEKREFELAKIALNNLDFIVSEIRETIN